ARGPRLCRPRRDEGARRRERGCARRDRRDPRRRDLRRRGGLRARARGTGPKAPRPRHPRRGRPGGARRAPRRRRRRREGLTLDDDGARAPDPPPGGHARMIYYLLYPLHTIDGLSFLNVLRYVPFRALAATMTALLLSFGLYPWFIRRLQKKQIGQVVRTSGPETHLSKAGTPTMGGALMLLALLLS